MRMLGTVVIFFFACLLPFKVVFHIIWLYVVAYCSLFDQGIIWFVRRYVAFCLISFINITFGFSDTWSHNLENVQLYCPGFDHMGGHIALRDP